MDKSWNFLVETQNFEMSALLQLFLDSGFEVCADVSSMVKGMSKDLSLNVVNLDYEQFIDKVCNVFSLNYPLNFANRNNLMEKETLLLQCFLSIIVDNLSNSETISFANQYRFSNDKKENLKKEINTRIAASENFKLMLPYLVSSLCKPKEICLPSIVYGLPFHIIRPVLELSSIYISDSLKNNKHFKWIPVVSTLVGMRQEYARPFEVEAAKDYLDTIIRFDSTFTSQKYSTLSVMLSLYKSLHDGAGLNDSLIEELSSFLQQKETAFRVQLIKRAKREIKKEEDFKKAFMELIRFLMKRLFPCDDEQQGVLRNNDMQCIGEGNVAFFYYKFPYSKFLSNAKYVIPADDFEKEAVKLYLSCNNIDLNEYLVDRNELLERINQNGSGWRVVTSWDDQSVYPKGVVSIKSDNPYNNASDINKLRALIDDIVLDYESLINHVNEVDTIQKEKHDSIFQQIDSNFTFKMLETLIEYVDNGFEENLKIIRTSSIFGNNKKLNELAEKLRQLREERDYLAKKISELETGFRTLRHDTSTKIGIVRYLLDQLPSNNYTIEDVEFAQKKLSELDDMLQNAGKDKDVENPARLNLIGELKKQIQCRDNSLFSIIDDYSDNDPIWIDFEESELGTVLDNVFDNIKRHGFLGLGNAYSKNENKVRISIDKLVGGFVNVYISNNGMEFEGNKADAEKVFEFSQSYGNSGNRGIGLYSVREIMQRHGGDVSFIPKPNEEFCVTVLLRFKYLD